MDCKVAFHFGEGGTSVTVRGFIVIMKVWSLAPCLSGEEGHDYPYHLAIGQACRLNGWEHIACIPQSCSISSIPSHWEKSLAVRIRKKFSAFIHSAVLFCKVLKKIKRDKAEKKVIFIEQFFLGELLAFSIAAILIRPSCNLWLLYRYSLQQMGRAARIYHCLHKIFAKYMNLQILTDSELLAEDQVVLFNKMIHVMPIPHAIMQERRVCSTDHFYLWWPGGARFSKGLCIIQKLAAQLDGQVRLLITESISPYLEGESIYSVPSPLSREEYMAWMHSVDLVLLPYDPYVYRLGTSGIFVEAVTAGTLVAVTDGTWMAHELKKFGLKDLVVDWERKDLLVGLREKSKNPSIRGAFQKMQQEYCRIHSIQGFAEAMRSLRPV